MNELIIYILLGLALYISIFVGSRDAIVGATLLALMRGFVVIVLLWPLILILVLVNGRSS
jgi:tetrahydromethanopterin S-methyltransferase subunit E